MNIHYLQHVPFEGLSMITGWATSRGSSLSCTKLYEADYCFPSNDDYDVLIILGGPMSVHDAEIYPWLADEKVFILDAIEAGKYVLGICLGAQLIAQALGAKVKPNHQKEIGWFPIAFTDPLAGHPLLSGLNHAMTVLHWHGERFDIPEGAIPLASSAACDHQGFLYQDKVLALQFHLEMDGLAINKIIDACKDELVAGETIQSADIMLEKSSQYNLKSVLFRLLDNWVGRI